MRQLPSSTYTRAHTCLRTHTHTCTHTHTHTYIHTTTCYTPQRQPTREKEKGERGLGGRTAGGEEEDVACRARTAKP